MTDYRQDDYTACACCGHDADGSTLCYQCQDHQFEGHYGPESCHVVARDRRFRERLAGANREV